MFARYETEAVSAAAIIPYFGIKENPKIKVNMKPMDEPIILYLGFPTPVK